MTRKFCLAALLGAFWAVAAPLAGLAAEGYSVAQTALFGTPHLQNVTRPLSLRYDFRRSGTQGEGFTDRVEATVTEVLPDGKKNLEFQFLTGVRERRFGPIEGFRGNSLIMLFLQRDVEEMSKATGGGQGYFHNRIRHAIREGAEVDEVPFESEARQLTATRVTIRPFENDPKRDRMAGGASKTYEFLLSPEFLGGLYRIRTVVSSSNEGGASLLVETLTYASAGD